MTALRILVAGVGNIFLGDDAFGVEVARRLIALGVPEGARVVDFGIRGLDLTYALLEGYDAVILVDALPRGEPPGTLAVLELPASEPLGPGEPPAVQGHNLDPARVLRLARAMGARLRRAFLVGCEPRPADEVDDFGAGLGREALAAVDEAVPLVVSLVGWLLGSGEIGTEAIANIPGPEEDEPWHT
jgi:hydrogenase maturation protease